MIDTMQRIVLIMLAMLGATRALAGPYDASANRAADWLVLQRNIVDGSWGAKDEVRNLYTSEAVLALAALNRRGAEYFGGLTWLENHGASNLDFKVRRVLALQGGGDSISGDTQYMTATAANGWGLTSNYLASPLDTALALQALNQVGISGPVSNALAYLKASQLTGSVKGWAVGQETTSDPATTAQVVKSLVLFRATDSTLATSISNGVAALGSVSSSSSATHQAASALALLRDNSASAQAATLLNALMASQSADGSWGGDVYTTSLAIEALAAGMGADLATQRTAVVVPDVNLRAAINLALGRNALDALNQGELAKLTTLDISNRGVTTLSGLEFAANLTYLDARNNALTSLAPIQGLTKLSTLLTDGNPNLPISPAVLQAILQLLLD